MLDTDFDWHKAINFLTRKLEEYDRELEDAEVLFVDDDPNECTLFLHQCRRFRCRVTICNDPNDASAIINSGHFDFVLIDQKMPRITGLEILQSTLPRPATAFFLITGLQDSSVADKALKLGAFYAPKDSLPETLAMFLRKR